MQKGFGYNKYSAVNSGAFFKSFFKLWGMQLPTHLYSNRKTFLPEYTKKYFNLWSS